MHVKSEVQKGGNYILSYFEKKESFLLNGYTVYDYIESIDFLVMFQQVQHKLAEMKTEICVARAFLDNCYKLHNDQGLDSQQASMAKYW